jgi:hypothetical protein
MGEKRLRCSMKKNMGIITALMVVCLSLFWGMASASEQSPEAATSPVPVNTYYVSRYAPGASDSNPGTKTQPWSTIQHATRVVQPGDTVIVESMYYTGRIYLTTSGTASAPIKFIADGYVTTQGFTIEADYNHVVGFEITDTLAVDGANAFQKDCTGVFVRGRGNQILNNNIEDTTCVGIRVYASPVDSADTSDNIIRGNKVELAKDAGIAIFGRNNWIENNEVVRTVQKSEKWTGDPRLDADGFRFHGVGHTFIGNYIHGINFDDPLNWQYDDPDPNKKYIFVPHIDCFQSWNPVRDISIEGNVCEINSPNGKRFHYVIAQASSYEVVENGQTVIRHKEVQGLTIRNNIFRSDSTGFGAIALQGMARTSDLWFERRGVYVKDVVIVHNTFVRTKGLGDHAIWLRYVEDAVVQNNIFYDHNNNSANAYIYCGDSTYSNITCQDDHYQNDGVKRTINLQAGWNLVYQSSGLPSGTAYPNDLWQVDPEFVNFAAQDYHLQPISPAIDAGVDLGVSTDFDGNPRPIPTGGAYDIGAFEALDRATPTPGITGTPTFTPTTMPSITPLPIFTATATPNAVAITPSVTPSPTYTSTATPTVVTITPSVTPSPTYSVTATPTYGLEPFFEDVSQDFWAYSYIKTLYEHGYLSGVSTDPFLFGTGRGLTRGEGAVFVVRGVEGAEFHPPMPTASPFADVPLSHWAVEWVDCLKRFGFTEGCGVNNEGEAIFCVDLDHTRAEAAVYFVRMVEGPGFVPPQPDPNRPDRYDDVLADNSVWYNKWIYWAKDKGIVGNCEAPENLLDNLYRTNDTILREEAACMMYHAIYVAEPGTPTPTPTVVPSVTPIHDD